MAPRDRLADPAARERARQLHHHAPRGRGRADELIAARKARTAVDRDVRLQSARTVAAGLSRSATAPAPSLADALAAVLAGPHAEAQPPKQ